jgi:two-component system NtrC family sensor kinase
MMHDYDIDHLRPLVSASLDGMILTDIQGSIIEFNPAAEQMFGRQRELVIGRPVGSVVVPPDLRPYHERAMTRRLQNPADTQNRQRFETQGMRADGSTFPVELTVTEVVLPGGERLLVAYLRDITARMQLRVSEERYRLAIRGANDGIFEWDVEHGTAFYSERLEEIVGRRASDLVTIDSWHANVHADDLEPLKNETRKLLRGDIDRIKMEYRILRSDGVERWVQVTAATVRDGDGRVLRVGGSIGDITERKQADVEIQRQREALYQSEKLSALGSLLAGVAHELNNPLSIVVGQAQMLKDSAATTPFAERAEKIETAAVRCARIARTFLAMARQHKPARRPVQLERIAEDVLGLLDYSLRSSGIAVERSYSQPLPAVQVDPDQINQVLSNLIVNAQQALAGRAEQRSIRIEIASSGGQWIEARISDNGPGIPPHLRRRVFEPFFTTKPAGQGPGSGTGIGLAVSHGIVSAHGGTLEAGDSEMGGACFILRLPLGTGAAESTSSSARAATPMVASGLTALVLDDEHGVADLLAEILASSGFRVTIATDGQNALERLLAEDYSVILTDLRMPGLDGPSLFARLRGMRPALSRRIIFVTGDMLSPDVADFLRDSGQPCLEKPFSPDELRRSVAAILARD